jgi:hypothetical protein
VRVIKVVLRPICPNQEAGFRVLPTGTARTVDDVHTRQSQGWNVEDSRKGTADIGLNRAYLGSIEIHPHPLRGCVARSADSCPCGGGTDAHRHREGGCADVGGNVGDVECRRTVHVVGSGVPSARRVDVPHRVFGAAGLNVSDSGTAERMPARSVSRRKRSRASGLNEVSCFFIGVLVLRREARFVSRSSALSRDVFISSKRRKRPELQKSCEQAKRRSRQ